MKIQLVESHWAEVECDALLMPIFEDEDFATGIPSEIDSRLDGLLSELRDTEEWKGKNGDITVLYRAGSAKTQRLILLGAGKQASFRLSSIREMAIKAVSRVKGYNLRRVGFCRRSKLEAAPAAQAAVEGVILATYDGDDYKTEDRAKNFLEEIVFVAPPLGAEHAEVESALARGRVLAEAANFARRLVNEPANRINPSNLAEQARSMAEEYGLDFQVLDEPEMQNLGMEAVLAVSRGSDEPARFVVLSHWGSDEAAPPVVLIGKGVTFDSGGYSLKPPKFMEDMKVDKAGACAVMSAMRAIAELNLKCNVIGMTPLVENMVSGRAQRPGDIVRTLSGKTVEVRNTDAEGRLILCDALYYAQRHKPRVVVDIATLTGACVVALGHLRAGLFSNDDQICKVMEKASEQSGERLWRLPLDDDYRDCLDTPIADMKNIGGRSAGAVTAAKFLQEFVGDFPWCHLDIAGVDLYPDKAPLNGATGFGVRTLVEFVRELE